MADEAGGSAAEGEVRAGREELIGRRFVAVLSSVIFFVVFSAMMNCGLGERFHTPQAAGVFWVAWAAASIR